jgi:hypothetical protein
VVSTSHCVSSLLHGEVCLSATMWKATLGCGANQVEFPLFQSSFPGCHPLDDLRCHQNAPQPSGNHIISFSGRRKVMSSAEYTPVLPFRTTFVKTHQILSLRRKNLSLCGPSSSKFTCIPWKWRFPERRGGKSMLSRTKRACSYSSMVPSCCA